jgi:rhodanese-related sulfurtransferase
MPGARHLPLAALPSRLAEIDPDKRVVLHCQGAGRSAIATSFLLAQGIAATNLRGGFSEWERLGLPVESDAAASAR